MLYLVVQLLEAIAIMSGRKQRCVFSRFGFNSELEDRVSTGEQREEIKLKRNRRKMTAL